MMKSHDCSPIVLFTYNRLEHTQRTIEALQQNYLADKSQLIIYSDAEKHSNERKTVARVRSYLKEVKGFKDVTLIERKKNLGLAKSIIEGVSSMVNEYGKVIVLEDDMLTSPYFLTYMNEALNYYKEKPQVWHISGWNYPVPVDQKSKNQAFLWRVMNCWGWATWADRWQYFDNDVERTIKRLSKGHIERFNLDGTENFFGQIIENKQGKKNTWAIFWYATIFAKGGLCLNPTQTLVENIGLDGKGENCDDTDAFTYVRSSVSVKNFKTIPLKESKINVDKIKKFYLSHNRTKFGKIKKSLKNLYSKEQFNPSFLGILINPFYFSRKGLHGAIIELIGNLKGTVLDIGCGTKPYEGYCECDEYIGLELDNKKNRESDNADRYYDGETLPFNDGSLDSVLTSQVLEHVISPDNFLQEIHRVLDDNGLLLLSVPLVWDEHEQPHDYTRYTSFGLKNILEKNGFNIIYSKKTANDFTTIVQLLSAYLYKTIFVKNGYVNFILTITIISPIHIMGLFLSKILPINNDFYLDNVVLARKNKNEF